jgi:lysozyme
MTRTIFPRRPHFLRRYILSILALLMLAGLIVTAVLVVRDNGSRLKLDGEEMMRYAEQYGVSIEYLQLIMDDYVVYTDNGKYQYRNLNAKMPRQDYQADLFVSDVAGRISYIDSAYPDVSYGVDVSTYQGDIDWQAVAQDGIDFAMIRVGYRGYDSGRLVLDERFVANIEGALATGLPVGVYFFSQAVDKAEAEAEAEFVLDAIQGYDISYPVVFDMEEINGESSRIDNLDVKEATAITKAFCRAIKKAGYQPMIYGNTKWLASRIDLGKLKDYPLWFAQYYDKPLIPYDFAVWQYTSSGTVAGIPADVDINICFEQPW